MTLVMAFIGENGAVMAGDMREITFLGDPVSTGKLEQELYSGLIATDEDLARRAGELGVKIRIRDDKVKVTEEGGVLMGEVTSLEAGLLRKRRVYASAGSYAIIDLEGERTTPRGRGRAASFVVLGNERTKAIANRCIQEMWRDGTLKDAVEVIVKAMEAASRATASVSRSFIIVRTDRRVDLRRVMGDQGPG